LHVKYLSLWLNCFFYCFWNFCSYLNFAVYYGIENSFWDLVPHVVQVRFFLLVDCHVFLFLFWFPIFHFSG
jgi:hypothetical protein